MASKRNRASRKPSAPPPSRWLSHDLLRYGGQAAAIAAVLGLLSFIFPSVRDLANSDPPPLIGKKSFDPIAQAVQSIQTEQGKFVGRLNDFDLAQLQRECRSLADRKANVELRIRMDGNDRLAQDVMAQVNKSIAETRRALEAGGQIPEC